MKKKIIALIFTGILLLSSCNSRIAPNQSDTTKNSETTQETDLEKSVDSFDVFNFTSAELKEMYIEAFRENKFIIHDPELSKKYSNLGYKLSNDYSMKKLSILDTIQKCYYPIEIQGELIYLNYMGEICIGQHGLSITNAHIPDNYLFTYTTLCTSPIETIILKDGCITAFCFNKIVRSWVIPEEIKNNIYYCGYSYFNGYIFKSGNNVYSIDLSIKESEFKLIATGVQSVIDADYNFAPDLWCTTLLHMEDGSIKAYIEWEPELMPLYSDGEYSDITTPNVPYYYKQ